jgi:uncharacterized coiled-coil DUF342 family protein
MSGEHTAERLTTLQWAHERLANTERLAATKLGADRDGWLEDVGYWKEIISIITAAPETAAERDRLRAEVERLTEDLSRKVAGNRALNEQWQEQARTIEALRAEKAELVAAQAQEIEQAKRDAATERTLRLSLEGERTAAEARIRELELASTGHILRIQSANDRVRKLTEALQEMCDLAKQNSQYKGEYLAKKHGDAEEIAKARAALTKATSTEGGE